jgi:hypothetical protein
LKLDLPEIFISSALDLGRIRRWNSRCGDLQMAGGDWSDVGASKPGWLQVPFQNGPTRVVMYRGLVLFPAPRVLEGINGVEEAVLGE